MGAVIAIWCALKLSFTTNHRHPRHILHINSTELEFLECTISRRSPQ